MSSIFLPFLLSSSSSSFLFFFILFFIFILLWPKGWILDFEFGFERLDFVVVIGLILAYGLWWLASVGLGCSSSSCDCGSQWFQLWLMGLRL